MTPVDSDLEHTLQRLIGLPVWHVGAGGAAGATFSLAIGSKVPRGTPLKNPEARDDYRFNEGEYGLVVWCSWRLDGPTDAVASSDSEPSVCARSLSVLEGQLVRDVGLISKACDLKIRLDMHELLVFCDHVGDDPSFDGNWDFYTPTTLFGVGPGWATSVEDRG